MECYFFVKNALITALKSLILFLVCFEIIKSLFIKVFFLSKGLYISLVLFTLSCEFMSFSQRHTVPFLSYKLKYFELKLITLTIITKLQKEFTKLNEEIR